jgi:hypothetical protein
MDVGPSRKRNRPIERPAWCANSRPPFPPHLRRPRPGSARSALRRNQSSRWSLDRSPVRAVDARRKGRQALWTAKGAEALTGPSHLAMGHLVTAARLGVRNITSVAAAPEDEAVRRFRDCKRRSPKLGSSSDKPGEPFWRRCSIGRSRPSSKGSALLSKVRSEAAICWR